MDMNSTEPTQTDENLEGLLLTSENPVYCTYIFWASILVVKTLLMSLLTAGQRFGKKSFSNPEDLAFQKNIEVQFHDPDVERVRRAHRNDLENVLPLLIMALIYISTGPNPTVARILIRIASISRILHTLVYAFRPVPQPSRMIAFFVTFSITVYMALYVAMCTIIHI